MASTSLARAVLEVAVLPTSFVQQRLLLEAFRPVEAHRLGAVAEGDVLRAVLVALDADVLGRVAGADQKHVLAGELVGGAEVVGVQHAAGELVEALEVRHVRRREVAVCDDDVVEFLRDQPRRLTGPSP